MTPLDDRESDDESMREAHRNRVTLMVLLTFVLLSETVVFLALLGWWLTLLGYGSAVTWTSIVSTTAVAFAIGVVGIRWLYRRRFRFDLRMMFALVSLAALVSCWLAHYLPKHMHTQRINRATAVVAKYRAAIRKQHRNNDEDAPLVGLIYAEVLGEVDVADALKNKHARTASGDITAIGKSVHSPFAFVSGCTTKAAATNATHTVSQLDVTLRHNLLQEALYRRLVRKFGAANVGTELETGVGTNVDLVVRRPNGYWFYEIKTGHSPRGCIREAIGQLLEYSFWPGAQEARRLIVVGESPLDPDGSKYLQRLKKRFSIPIQYKQITVKKSRKQPATNERMKRIQVRNSQ